MALITIDVGGSSIKYSLFSEGKLGEVKSKQTPDNLEDYYSCLKDIVREMRQESKNITGVAMSSPGAVNQATGYIEGFSALPYIHGFDIHHALEEKLGLPLAIENDANCAALAEVAFGAAKHLQNVLFLVLGTGVGGAVVINGKIHHGKHLFGGEFGFMLMDEKHTFSDLGTAVNMAKRYNQRCSTNLTGQEVFRRAIQEKDSLAQEEMECFTFNVAKGIYNLQYAFDPELIVIGGAISQAEWLVPELNKQMNKIIRTLETPPFLPEIKVCHYRNSANLIGAAVNFHQNKS